MAAYCDPLAAASKLNGCTMPKPTSAEQQQGITSWEARAKPKTGTSDGQGAFAGDITAYSLFGDKVKHPEAAMRYIYNVTNALPDTFGAQAKDYSIPSKYTTTYNGQQVLKDEGYNIYVDYLARQSKLSLSQFALMKIFADRLTLDNIKIPVSNWVCAKYKTITEDGKSIKVCDIGQKEITYEPTSNFGLLQFEANKRFSDPGWYDRVQQMPTPALLKEMAYMNSLQLVLEMKRYEQQQLQTAMYASVAADVSAIVKTFQDLQHDAKNTSANKANISSKLKGILHPDLDGSSPTSGDDN